MCNLSVYLHYSHLGTRTFNTDDLNVLRLTLTYNDLKGYNYVSSCCHLESSDCDEKFVCVQFVYKI